MKRYNWRLATTRLQRQGTAALLATSLAVCTPLASAAVVGVGDITPAHDVEDEDGNTVTVPNLPQFGGPVPDGGNLIVGGTGQNVGGTAAGEMTIGIPADTDPLTSVTGVIGGNVFGLGLVQIAGLNSEWAIEDYLIVGDQGQGFLELVSGARLSTAGTNGAGEYDLIIGNVEGSQGFITVSGFGSLLVNVDVSIGHESFGDVQILDRARMETRLSATIGTVADVSQNVLGQGYVLVDGLGTRWNVGVIETPGDSTDGMDLILGDEGRGTLEITNQARVRVGNDTILGNEDDAYGEVIVTGRNSQLWTFNDMFIGISETTVPPAPPSTSVGTGVVNINDNGMVRTDGTTFIASRGTVNLAGGTLLTPLVDNQGGIIRGNGVVDADLVVNNGDIRNAASVANLRERLLFTGVVTNNDNIESIGGEMEFLGQVTNNGPDGDIYGKDAIFRFRGGLVNNAGATVTLDNTIVESSSFVNNGNLIILPMGESTLAANVTLAATSMLDMTLGDDFSQLFLIGSGTLGGVLDLSLASGYAPEVGDSFAILSGAPMTGTFASIVSPGTLWNVDYNPTSVVVTYGGVAAPGVGADFNGDGIVNGDDLAVWKSNFGKGSNPPPPALQSEGDANGDGVVDGNDFMIIQRQWGGPPAVPALAAVPEPSSVVLAMAALAIPLACRRRGSR